MNSKPQEQKSHLSDIFGAFPDLIFKLSSLGTITDYYSPDPKNLFKPPEEFLNEDFRSCLPALLHEPFGKAFFSCLESGQVASFHYSLPIGGKTQFFEGRFSPYPDGQGALFVARDISDQHQTEEKLHSLSQLHQLIVEFSSLLVQSKIEDMDQNIFHTLQLLGEYAQVDRVYIFDFDEPTDEINNTFEWCGEDIHPEIENLQGIPFNFVPRWKEKFERKEHVYIPLVSEIDDQYIAEKEILEPQGIQSLLTIPMFYGDRFMGFIGFDSVKRIREWSKEHIDLLRLAGEIIAGTIGRMQFEREILSARQQAEQANKAKSEFLASMSHEIRTPMNAILGFSEILFNSTEDPKTRSFISGILSSGRTLLYLINDILDLSRIEAGQMIIAATPTRITDILEEISQIFSAKVIEKNLDYRTNIQEGFPEVILTDDVRLRQILFNLMGNAVKFTHSGFVELAARFVPNDSEPGFIDMEISVTDTGIGIPKSFQERIFEAFVQIESDNSRQYGGTGLGLAICKKLVHLMNGGISLESEVNRGSQFSLFFKRIPISSHLPEKKNLYEWPSIEIVFEPATILVIDDVDFNRDLVRSFLKGLRLTLIEASSGQEGVAMAKAHVPDLILMDLRMPHMNGFQAASLLKEDPKTQSIKCVAFTASSMKHDEEHIQRSFDGFLLKPLTRNDLMQCLAKFLPHTSPQNTGILPQSIPSAVGEILKSILSQPISFPLLADALSSQIVPDLRKLMLYLDYDVLENMDIHFQTLGNKFPLASITPLLSELKKAAAQYDFETFNHDIQQLNLLVQSLINHNK